MRALRAAALDIGTNTLLCTIAERRAGEAEPRPLYERARVPRLGQGVDRTRALDTAARQRALVVIDEYARALDQYAVDRAHVGAVGTSALRDASGADEFLDEVARRLGVRPTVIDGEREAELTFVGGVSGLGLAGALTVFDVGGGSTEVVSGRLERDRDRVRHQ